MYSISKEPNNVDKWVNGGCIGKTRAVYHLLYPVSLAFSLLHKETFSVFARQR